MWRIYASVKWIGIGSDNGLSPIRRQAIILTNAWLLSIGPLGTNFSEILVNNWTISFKKLHLKISSAKWQPFCPGEDELSKANGPIDNKSPLIQVMAWCCQTGVHYPDQSWTGLKHCHPRIKTEILENLRDGENWLRNQTPDLGCHIAPTALSQLISH